MNIFLDNIIKMMIIIVMIFGVSYIRQLKNKVIYDIQFKESNKKIGTLEECNRMIDEFITNEFNTYTVLKWNYKNLEILNSAMEAQMREDMINIIQNRMSNNMLSRLLCFYDKSAIPDVIAEKVFILITAYSININTRRTPQETKIQVQKMRKKIREDSM